MVLVLIERMKCFFVVISKKTQTVHLKPISKHKRAKEGIINVFFFLLFHIFNSVLEHDP